MRMVLASAYSKCSKLPWLHVCTVSISSLLSLLHTGSHESLEKLIMSATARVGRVGAYVPQDRKCKAESYSANSFPYHPNSLRLSCWDKYPICSLLVRPRELGYITGFLILYHSQPLSSLPLKGIHRVSVCASPRVQESQATPLATTTAVCWLYKPW